MNDQYNMKNFSAKNKHSGHKSSYSLSRREGQIVSFDRPKPKYKLCSLKIVLKNTLVTRYPMKLKSFIGRRCKTFHCRKCTQL